MNVSYVFRAERIKLRLILISYSEPASNSDLDTYHLKHYYYSNSVENITYSHS